MLLFGTFYYGDQMQAASSRQSRVSDAQQTRQRADLIKVSTSEYHAEIIEEWGRRIIRIKWEKSAAQADFYTADVSVTYAMNNGNTRQQSKLLRTADSWQFSKVKDKGEFENRLEDLLNRHYNHKLWILRALRG